MTNNKKDKLNLKDIYRFLTGRIPNNFKNCFRMKKVKKFLIMLLLFCHQICPAVWCCEKLTPPHSGLKMGKNDQRFLKFFLRSPSSGQLRSKKFLINIDVSL